MLLVAAGALAVAVLLAVGHRDASEAPRAAMPAAPPTPARVVLPARAGSGSDTATRAAHVPPAGSPTADRLSERAAIQRALQHAFADRSATRALTPEDYARLADAVLRLRAAGHDDPQSAAAALAEVEMITGLNIADLGDLLAPADDAPQPAE